MPDGGSTQRLQNVVLMFTRLNFLHEGLSDLLVVSDTTAVPMSLPT
jgi:hypothetical protein